MLQELQVDTRNKEEEVFIVTSSADFIPAYPGQVPTTDEGIPNPCLSSVGPGMQVHREAATQPRTAENSDMILRVGVGCFMWASRLQGPDPGVWPPSMSP